MSYTDNHFVKGLSDLKLVAPCLEDALGCSLTILDKGSDKVHATLDYNGIDAFAHFTDADRGIAFRVQKGVNYQTFSIRDKRKTGRDSELQKFDSSWSKLQPNYFMQVYIVYTSVYVGIAPYAKLMQYVVDNYDSLPSKNADVEGNSFKYVDWSRLQEEGVTWLKIKKLNCEACKRV